LIAAAASRAIVFPLFFIGLLIFLLPFPSWFERPGASSIRAFYVLDGCSLWFTTIVSGSKTFPAALVRLAAYACISAIYKLF